MRLVYEKKKQNGGKPGFQKICVLSNFDHKHPFFNRTMLDKYCRAQKDLFSGVLHDIYNFKINKMAAKMTFMRKFAKNDSDPF